MAQQKMVGTLMRWLRLIIIALIIPLAACASTPRSATYLVESSAPYTLDTGDVVRINVYGDAELSNTYRVEDNGSIAFPLVGMVDVRGMTPQMAGARISAALANGYMRNPNVALEISQYRPFFIQGEVSSSGQYAYQPAMTVRAAISTAGGYTDTADRTKVTIYRPVNGEMIKASVNLDFPIKPGDTIVVLDRWL